MRDRFLRDRSCGITPDGRSRRFAICGGSPRFAANLRIQPRQISQIRYLRDRPRRRFICYADREPSPGTHSDSFANRLVRAHTLWVREHLEDGRLNPAAENDAEAPPFACVGKIAFRGAKLPSSPELRRDATLRAHVSWWRIPNRYETRQTRGGPDGAQFVAGPGDGMVAHQSVCAPRSSGPQLSFSCLAEPSGGSLRG